MDSEASSSPTNDSTPSSSSPAVSSSLNNATSDSETSTENTPTADELRTHSSDASSTSDLNRGAGSNASSVIVERALRSRVAYSERPSKVLAPSAHREDTIRMANVALCNERIYCTIDCMKGLKVQMLSIICIFRIGNKIFASGYTPFPPPSSLKRKERSRLSRPKRTSPYRKSESGDDEADDDSGGVDSEEYTPRVQLGASPHAHAGVSYLHSSALSGVYSSQSMHQAQSVLSNADLAARGRVAVPFGSGTLISGHGLLDNSNGAGLHSIVPSDILSASNPYATSLAARATLPPSTATAGYLSQFMSPNASHNAPTASAAHSGPTSVSHSDVATSREKALPVAGAQLPSCTHDSSAGSRSSSWNTVNSRMKALATPYAEHTLAAINRVAHLHSFLNNVPLASALDDIAQWCLSGGVSMEAKLVARVLDVLAAPSFVGPLEHSRAYELLSASLASHLSGIFLIRTVKDDPLSLEIYGLYKAGSQPNSTSTSPATAGTIQEYYATVRIQIGSDPHVPAIFWIDTEANADESRCASLSSLVTYVSRVTGWSPIDRDCIQDPQVVLSSAAVTTASVPQNRLQSWTTLIDTNALSQQYGIISPEAATFTSPYDMFSSSSASCYHPSTTTTSGSSFTHYSVER